MIKIGLKAVRISAGLTELFEINGDPSWTTKVRDLRSDLECIENIQLGKNYLMLTNIEVGFLLSIVIPISGRKGDCFNMCIFVPNDAEDTTCVETIIDEVVTQFGSGRFNKEKLQDVVDKCGVKKSSAYRIVNQSKGDVVAYRVFKNEAERRKLLGALNQKYYANYKMVMFLREEDKAVQRCDDLTSKKIVEDVVVKAPQQVEGFKPYIYGELFDKDMWLEKESNVDVIWKRENYNDIQKSLQVGVGEVKTPIVKELSEYTITCNVTNPWKDKEEDKEEKVILSKDRSFEYRNNDYDLWITVGEKKEKYSSINRYIIAENNSLCVQIVYKDYLDEKETVLDLDLKEQQEIKINMKKRKELKIEDKIFVLKSDKDDMSFNDFKVEKHKGIDVLTVKADSQKTQKSEVNGEEPKGKDTMVEWLWRFVSFLVGVLVVLVVLVWLYVDSQRGVGGGKRKANVEQEAVAAKDASDVNVACINYLKENLNNGWSKDSLESYPLTRGLYDAMINYKFDKMERIFARIYSARSDKSNFGNPYDGIVNWVKKIKNKDDIKKKFEGKEFNDDSKKTINLDEYLGKLKEEASAKRSNSSSDIESQNSVPEEKNDSLDYSMTGEDRNDI